MSSLAKRLWIYQKERFPLGILTITTAAVLASTFAVLEWTGYYDIPLWKYVALGVAGLSFMLHTRIIDEIRDKDVDDVYHPDRPVQRGLVSIRELTVLGYANGGVFIGIHALLDPLSGLLSAGLLLYSIVARYEVGPLAWLKPRFWLQRRHAGPNAPPAMDRLCRPHPIAQLALGHLDAWLGHLGINGPN